MKKWLIWVFEWKKSVHYCWGYKLFSSECKELTSMLDPLLYRWGVPPVVIRCVHVTMQMWVLPTWIKAQGFAIVMSLYIDFIHGDIHSKPCKKNSEMGHGIAGEWTLTWKMKIYHLNQFLQFFKCFAAKRTIVTKPQGPWMKIQSLKNCTER